MGPVRIRHSSHDFGWQSGHSVDLAGWQAKMASIEIWIPWRNAHKPHANQCLIVVLPDPSHHQPSMQPLRRGLESTMDHSSPTTAPDHLSHQGTDRLSRITAATAFGQYVRYTTDTFSVLLISSFTHYVRLQMNHCSCLSLLLLFLLFMLLLLLLLLLLLFMLLLVVFSSSPCLCCHHDCHCHCCQCILWFSVNLLNVSRSTFC